MARAFACCVVLLASLLNCVECSALPPGMFCCRCSSNVIGFGVAQASKVESMPAKNGANMNECVFCSWTVRGHRRAFRFPSEPETSRNVLLINSRGLHHCCSVFAEEDKKETEQALDAVMKASILSRSICKS